MFSRTLKQKILISLQNPLRLKACIEDPSHQAYKDNFYIKDHHIFVKEDGEMDKLNSYGLYNDAVLLSGSKSLEDVWQNLKARKEDYNSHFKKTTGMSLDDFEKKYLV